MSGPLDEELQLAHGGTADMEHGPAGGQQDRGGDQDEPEVHGDWETWLTDLKEWTSFGASAAGNRSISMQWPPGASRTSAEALAHQRPPGFW